MTFVDASFPTTWTDYKKRLCRYDEVDSSEPTWLRTRDKTEQELRLGYGENGNW